MKTNKPKKTGARRRPAAAKGPKAATPAVESPNEMYDPRAYYYNLDLRTAGEPWEKRKQRGVALRAKCPREAHAEWKVPEDRPDPVGRVMATNVGRQEHLIPLRMARMASSPFAFLRGAADVMAWDLSHTPNSGVYCGMVGDAHINNFGLYGTPQKEVVVDINDFDEATVGPWEWDLKRLTASVNVAGRENGLNRRERRIAVMRCVAGYRLNAERTASMGFIEVWYRHAFADRMDPNTIQIDKKSKAILVKTVKKAQRTNNASFLAKVAERSVNGGWRFRNDPPVLTKVDKETWEKVTSALYEYAETVPRERRFLLHRYHVADVAHRVVGVGSVGTRAYMVMMFGNSDADPLFLQVKEATPPAHAPYLPPLPDAIRHEGARVVFGHKVLQASTDPMLGWTQIDGRPFYVRQMKNLKASLPVEFMTGAPFYLWAQGTGMLLARGHARTGDPAIIAGYCGTDEALDVALADWAEAYGDQTERDHAALVEAIKTGRLTASDQV